MAISPDALAHVPLFAPLKEKERAKLAKRFLARTFVAGDEIVSEGNTGTGFYVITAGEVSVVRGGREVARLGPGSYFGEIALIDGGPRTATVTATGDLEVVGLTAWDFRNIVEGDPRICWALAQELARRVREAKLEY